jgi:hypothetical protein
MSSSSSVQNVTPPWAAPRTLTISTGWPAARSAW